MCAGAAQAETVYELGRVKGEIFAYAASDIVQQSEDIRTVREYRIPATQLVDRYDIEVDCRRDRLRTVGRMFVRTDMSEVRNTLKTQGPAEWTKPQRRAIGGILMRAVCGHPDAPSGLKSTEVASMSAYLRQASDEVLAAHDPAKLALVVDGTSVGDCIFRAMDEDTKLQAIVVVQQGRAASSADGFVAAVNALSERCIGRDSADDPLLVGAAMSIFTRFGVVTRLAQERKIAEQHLAAAWYGAPDEVRAPLLARAAQLHDPNASVEEIRAAETADVAATARTLAQTPALKAALERVTHLNDNQKEAFLMMYFMAAAMSEDSERRLAALTN